MPCIQHQCRNEARRELVRKAGKLNGIDYLEIASSDQRTLAVQFLFPLAAPLLIPDNIAIEGGVRVRDVAVTKVQTNGSLLTVTVNSAGDYSTYTLRLVTSRTVSAPPSGYDSQLSAVDFSFKAACDSDFDCRPAPDPPEPLPPSPVSNYLAKDYASFRRLMLDRLSSTIPDWTERNPSDLGVTLVETFAYVADHLSYYQDAVATEAYLGTARRRVSVRRHARLLNYALHEGCNARAFVQLQIQPAGPADGYTLPAGSAVLTQDAVSTFETMHPIELRSANNAISFYSWGDTDCTLPAGATCCTLRNQPMAPPIDLIVGDFLLFEEIVSPVTFSLADADSAHRHIVRITNIVSGTDSLDGKPAIDITWSAADALPFDLRLSATGPDGLVETAIARGNIVLADHGATMRNEIIDLDQPRMPRPNLTFREPLQDGLSASDSIKQDPRAALPAVHLTTNAQPWTARRDLLGSNRFALDFVVETENDGSAFLRFGDGVNGMQPAAGSTFTTDYRIGSGRGGNVGAEALQAIVCSKPGITQVRNPLPASGGADPESLDDARLFAPQSFRVQQRAVTPADYAAVAMRHRLVRSATARFRWTGSWYTVFLTIDRMDGSTTDDAFNQTMRDYIDSYRMAGYDLEIQSPIYVPLDIAMSVCVGTGYFQSDVQAGLSRAFAAFFQRANFTFGQDVYLSQIYDQAMRVPGVDSVTVVRFQRYGRPSANEIMRAYIGIEPLELAMLANDPSLPENGRIEFDMNGGL